MTSGRVRIGGRTFPVHSLNTLVIGSGAAGLNAAVRLHELGQTDVAVVTERLGAGASAESGSDKQTYYKLSLAGDVPDSAAEMARDLAAGGSMHGDIALAEAQGSLEAFFRLVARGVPFPHDRFGTYVGYKTDHDPRQRATSAGPLTSKLMFEALSGEIRRRHIRVFDRHAVIAILTAGAGPSKRVIGAAALDTRRLGGPERGFVLFNAVNVIAATGGPGGLYEHSVYPESQSGSHGLLFEAGAVAQNLTESQFGMASTKFRWNVSGTYQQAVPRYISTGAGGGDEREFLNDGFPDMGALAGAVFLKGYQWPFDPRKVAGGGSSLIDLLVYQETVVKGRRVFLDFRSDARGDGRLAPFEPSMLPGEAADYLRRSGALRPTPIARLMTMNPPAVELYRAHGIDLRREPLEIAVCAQHNNGGFRGSIWWQSNVRGLFPVGELCGTHGVVRPGGSALNAGQVGSARAALFIRHRRDGRPLAAGAFARAAGASVARAWQRAERMLEAPKSGDLTPQDCLAEIRPRMSGCGAVIREPGAVRAEKAKAYELWRRARRDLRVRSPRDLPLGFRALDLALTSAVYLEAVAEYLERGGRSRGSYIVPGDTETPADPRLEPAWAFALAEAGDFVSSHILEIRLDGRGHVLKRWVPVRPVPSPGGWFESIWADHRAGRVVAEPAEEE